MKKTNESSHPSKKSIEEKAQESIIVSEERIINKDSIRPGSSLAAASMKQHSVTEQLIALKK